MPVPIFNFNCGTFRINTTPTVCFFVPEAADFTVGIAGISDWDMAKISINGEPFATIAGSLAETGLGWYYYKLHTSEDANEGTILLNFQDTDSADVYVTLTLINVAPIGAAMTLSAGAITSTVLADNAVTAAKLNADCITSAKIADDAFLAVNFGDGAFTADAFAADSLVAATFATGAISADAIAAGAIHATALAANSIHATALAADSVTASSLKADAVTEIQSGLATAANLTAVSGRIPAALVGGKIDSNVGTITNDAITAASIDTGAIVAATFAADAISAASVAAATVTKIQNGLATSASIAALNDVSTGDISTTLDSQGLTAIRAAKLENLDNLDVASSTLATAANLTTVDGKLPAALVAGRIDASIGVVANDAITAAAIDTGALTAAAFAADSIAAAAIKADAVAKIQAGMATSVEITNLNDLSGADVQTVLDTQGFTALRAEAMDNMDAPITTRSMPGDEVTIDNATVTAIAEALLDTVDGIESSITVREALRIILAVVAGKTTIVGDSPPVVTFRNTTDTKNRVVAQMSGSQRTSVVLDKT
jgi:hypothetical protein